MKLGEVLELGRAKSINIDDNIEYRIAGVSSYGLGVKNRRKEFGKDLKMKKYQVIEKDYLMWCKVDTKNGAFGVTKDEHTGSLASTNMALAKIDTDKIHPDFLEFLFRFSPFHENITHLSSGSTNRKYLTPQQLCEQIEIPDLNLEEQLDFLRIQEQIQNIGLDKEITHQLDLIKDLRQTFLREAMQSILVSNETQDGATGADLLAEIQAEKAQLVKEKKIKKPKPLAPITEDELPFDIPENWTWCRLSDICEIMGGGTPSMSKSEYWNGTIPWISPKDMKMDFVSTSEMKITHVAIKESTAKLIPTNSLLVVGRSGILKRTLPVAINTAELTVNQDMKVLVPYKPIHLFIKLLLKGLENIILKNFVKYGMTVHSLKYSEFAEMAIPLPPLEIQERIVAKLDELMAVCDALETQVKQSQYTNELLLQQVLREALGA